jgi:hypothetical protein
MHLTNNNSPAEPFANPQTSFRLGSPMKYVLQLTAIVLSLLLMATLVKADPWKYERAGAKVSIDAERNGQIAHWEFGGKVLVDEKTPGAPLTWETTSGERATFAAEQVSGETDGVRIRGQMKANGRSTPAEIRYRVEEEGQRICVRVQMEKPGVAVREAGWTLPLSLEPRKRVWLRGDYGFEWDTRYFYQFMVSTTRRALPHPDRNEWRYFGLDRLGPNAFRLWKAESTRVSPLVMQEGRHATPAVQLYNATGGVTVEYPPLTGNAPQSLRVDAAGGGAVTALFWSRASLPASPEQPGLFGAAHEIILTAHESETAALAAQKQIAARYPAAPKPTAEQAMQEASWLRATPQSTAPQYVTGGYPFAPGTLRDTKWLRVAVAGRTAPLQTKPLAFWPDGSLKWVLLTFPIDPSRAVDSCPAPRISLRNGKFLPVAVRRARTAAPRHPTLRATQHNGLAQIVNGDWSVELATGAQWLRALRYKGKSLLRESKQQRQAYSDYLLDPTEVLPFERSAHGGERDAGVLRVEKVAVEESGPLRAVVRLEGMTDNREPTRIILRVEALAGRPELRITHTAEFRFKDPRRTFLTGLGLDLPLSGDTPKANLGGENVAKFDTALSLQESVGQNETQLLQNGKWRAIAQHKIPHDAPRSWAQLSNGSLEITGIIRNFQETAPKAMAVNARSGTLRFELWPSEAAPMDVRRYSNFPHPSQGESGSPTAKEDWAEKGYYPYDPFVGVTRTHEMLLAFWPKTAAPAPATLAADFQSPPLLYGGWDKYQSCGVVLPAPSPKAWPHAWQAWTNLANFWLWHRELHQWYGFWNFGDIRHRFRDGYGWIVPPETLIKTEPWKTTSPSVKLTEADVRLDYRPPNDWAYDNGRWGWGNTEGLPNLFLQQEYLRHGNRVVYFAAEAMARHARDVVTRHEGHWFGLGTRHGVQHWSDGNHEERQTTITEYRLNYFLSGDGRSRDTIDKLYDGVYSKTPVSDPASHSGRLGGLLFHWETTGSPQEAEQLHRYVALFLSPEGLFLAPNARFPGPVAAGPARELNGKNQFFYSFGGMHALIEYQQITHDPAVAAALIKVAETALANPEVQRGYNGGWEAAIAFAAMHAPDPAPYRKLLTDYLTRRAWQFAYQTVTQNPAHWSGETALLRNNVSISWFWNNWAAYITQSLNAPEVWSPEIEQQFQLMEKDGNKETPLRPSWQSEYDKYPELNEYLGSQQPWRNN